MRTRASGSDVETRRLPHHVLLSQLDFFGIRRLRVLALVVLALACGAHGTLGAQPSTPILNAADRQDVEQNLDFNRGWSFKKGDHPKSKKLEFDDSSWQQVRLPHDWAIAGPFDPNGQGSTGKLPWKGVGWYRKTFKFAGQKGDRVYFDFDGVMAFPEVYVNGQLAGTWDYGYTSFRIDATPFIKPHQTNVIAVRVDTRKHKSRWYPGAGIYRKVLMRIRGPVHFAHWGTFVTTPQVTESQATVRVQTTIENHGQAEASAQCICRLLAPDGSPVGPTHRKSLTLANGSTEVEFKWSLNQPERWDIVDPNLYKIHLVLEVGNKTADVQETSFGVRTFEFTADDGFHLNGRRVQLYGVNLHHDQGPLGAAFNRRAMQRQLEIMQDMGANAIRTSHNPSAPELLELCDQMGLLVWDECFDKWGPTAGRVRGEPPFREHGDRHLASLVRRDRNHPSVVVWSIGNEISNQPRNAEGKSYQRVKSYREIVRQHDPTRPVTMGCFIPETSRTTILDELDVTGWNYSRRYALHRKLNPDKPIVYSESASTLSTRGFYDLPLARSKTDYSASHQVDSYDLSSAAWSDIPDAEFRLMENDPYVAGEFVWTGFDYLGEPTPFAKQARSSYFGIVDLCGIPKDRFYLYRSQWQANSSTLHILPHWNWPERVGRKVPVFVYTDADSAELFLNGKSLGKRHKENSPTTPEDFIVQERALSGTAKKDMPANLACDGDSATRWCAASRDTDQWWQTDLGVRQHVRFLAIEFESEAKNYAYEVLASLDGNRWESIAIKKASNSPRWGGSFRAFHDVDCQARYIRVEFTELRNDAWASIREIHAYPHEVESSYYLPTYNYRLRWNDVVYEPGKLEVVAYDGEREVGRTSVRTAGEPAAIRLTPDRTRLAASGEDLCYVLVEAIDDQGVLCPLADNLIHVEVAGPAQLAAVGNGNPLSMESFQSDTVALFHGKAMLIVMTEEAVPGDIEISAKSDGLRPIRVTCESE